MTDLITGIQQIGIGVNDTNLSKHLYKKLFRMETLIFDDQAPASLMTRYTGDELHHRHAVLSMNLSGGGGFEIWQFTSRPPKSRSRVFYGDIGIFAPKIKTQDIRRAYQYFKNIGDIELSECADNHFWIRDQYQNHFQIVEGQQWFHSNNHVCGGVAGAVIGVSDMESSLKFYRDFLGLEETVSDTIIAAKEFIDHSNKDSFRVVVLRKPSAHIGAFSKLLGDVEIELVQSLSTARSKIYSERYWGDCGFIHLCFDVVDMDQLKLHAEDIGYHFSVDSKNSYAMETSAGRFCYVEDPDGTLIELVETHKVPIFKKLNIHLDIKNRKSRKPLPDWMIKMLAFSKVK